MNIEIFDQTEVLSHYGEELQSIVHCEECAELIQAVSKMRRYKNAPAKVYNSCRDNLVEEIADVLICIQQMMDMYKITEKELQATVTMKSYHQREQLALKGMVE